MKKLSKRAIAMIAVIAVLGVTILTLGLVRVRQDKYFFSGYESFQVYNLGSNSPLPTDINNKVSGKLESTGFSILSGMLEGQFRYSPTIVKDINGDPIYLTAKNIEDMAATGERYLLHFSYKDTKSVTVEGEKYNYDCAFVFLQEGDGEIVNVRVVPYVADSLHDGDGANSTEFLKIPDLRIKMRTSKLYVTIENAINDMFA